MLPFQLTRPLRARIAVGLAALALMAALMAVLGRWAEQREMGLKTQALQHALEVHALGLRGAIERYNDLPPAAARHPAVLALLEQPQQSALRLSVNRYLESLNRQVGAMALYVVDRRGLTLAASNWREDSSFVGQNYASRPYFLQALQGHSSMFYGVGLTTGQPGLFIAEPVYGDAGVAGVVVVKVDLGAVPLAWNGSPDPVVLTDERGVVFMSSVPDWVYRTRHPLSATDRDWIDSHNQYGLQARPFAPLPWRTLDDVQHPTDQPYRVVVRNGRVDRPLLALDTRLPTLGWTLSVMTDLSDVNQARRVAQVLTGLTLGIICLGVLFWRQRERRLSELRRHSQEAQLQHAARLASLGEMASTLAHELNQPLMALSNYAVAARHFADQQQRGPLLEAVGEIQSQARRAADIVTRMRGFVRQRSLGQEDCDLAAVVVSVLHLLRPELDARDVHVELDLPHDLPTVCGDRLLLEQLLVNLLMNAVHACKGLPAERRQLRVALQAGGPRLLLTVEDWGHGITPEQSDRLFEPFYTTKPDGLGLGLKICRSIAESHGGNLAYQTPAHEGAQFTLSLPTGPCTKTP